MDAGVFGSKMAEMWKIVQLTSDTMSFSFFFLFNERKNKSEIPNQSKPGLSSRLLAVLARHEQSLPIQKDFTTARVWRHLPAAPRRREPTPLRSTQQ